MWSFSVEKVTRFLFCPTNSFFLVRHLTDFDQNSGCDLNSCSEHHTTGDKLETQTMWPQWPQWPQRPQSESGQGRLLGINPPSLMFLVPLYCKKSFKSDCWEDFPSSPQGPVGPPGEEGVVGPKGPKVSLSFGWNSSNSQILHCICIFSLKVTSGSTLGTNHSYFHDSSVSLVLHQILELLCPHFIVLWFCNQWTL